MEIGERPGASNENLGALALTARVCLKHRPTWAFNMCMLAVMLLSSCCSESNFFCVVAPAGAHFKRGDSRSKRAQDAPAQNLMWQHANTLQRLPPPMLVQLRGGQGDENEEERRTRLLEETLLKGKGEGGQNDMAEDFLRQMPKGLSDWRHSFKASSRKKTFDVGSKFKRRFSFQERAAMAAKIAASGRVVPVIAERLHDGIQLPDTLKPKFSVPAALSLDKFVVILRQKLPWTDLYSRHSHIRLFVKEVVMYIRMSRTGWLIAWASVSMFLGKSFACLVAFIEVSGGGSSVFSGTKICPL